MSQAVPSHSSGTLGWERMVGVSGGDGIEYLGSGVSY